MSPSLRKISPATAAIDLLGKLKITKAPVPVDKVVKYLGAVLLPAPLDDEISGMVFVKEKVPVIAVNSLHHPNRQRFTVAHEIGHLVLHRQHVESSVHVDKQYRVLMRDARSSKGVDDMEIAANQFAAELLMPRAILEPMLEEEVLDLDDDDLLESLSLRFKVSKQAMSHRLGSVFLRSTDALNR
jgi:Zn-dependent peptidase ImmA (M78 family)